MYKYRENANFNKQISGAEIKLFTTHYWSKIHFGEGHLISAALPVKV